MFIGRLVNKRPLTDDYVINNTVLPPTTNLSRLLASLLDCTSTYRTSSNKSPGVYQFGFHGLAGGFNFKAGCNSKPGVETTAIIQTWLVSNKDVIFARLRFQDRSCDKSTACKRNRCPSRPVSTQGNTVLVIILRSSQGAREGVRLACHHVRNEMDYIAARSFDKRFKRRKQHLCHATEIEAEARC